MNIVVDKKTFIIIIRKVENTMHRADVEKKIKMMRKADKQFDDLVTLIEIGIEQFITSNQDKKSFYPKDIDDYRVNIKVKAIPITFEQKKHLLSYLKNKYIKFVRGDYFDLKKCWFSNQYRIKSHEIHCDPMI